MNSWDTKFLKAWESTRSKGKLRYCLLNGCFWSLGFVFALSLTDIYSQNLSYKSVLIKLAISLPIGFAFALSQWFFNERKFEKLNQQNDGDTN